MALMDLESLFVLTSIRVTEPPATTVTMSPLALLTLPEPSLTTSPTAACDSLDDEAAFAWKMVLPAFPAEGA